MIQRGEDFGFCGPSYQAPMMLQDAETCINYYPEIGESGEDKMPVALLGTPGLLSVATAATGTLSLFSGALTPATSGALVGLVPASLTTLYTGTLTAGSNFVPEVGYSGGTAIPPTTLYNGSFTAQTLSTNNTGFIGSGATPSSDSNGNALAGVIDSTGGRGSGPSFKFELSAATNPGQSYFATFTIIGGSVNVTLSSSTATYTYVGGTAIWTWAETLGLVAGTGYSMTYGTSGSPGQSTGSLSPTTVSNNTINFIVDQSKVNTFSFGIASSLSSNYFSVLTIVGGGINTTLSSASASFTNSGGVSTWSWGKLVGLTAGTQYTLTLQAYSGTAGSITPSLDNNGATVSLLYQSANQVTLQLTSAADLGQSYFTTLNVNGVSFPSSSATFTYSAGLSTNTWVWSGSANLISGTAASVSYSVSIGTQAPVRGGWVLPGGTQALIVAGSVLYLMTGTPPSANSAPLFALKAVGSLNTDAGPVCIRDNGTNFGGAGGFALIVDGQYGYYYNIATGGSGTTEVQFTGTLALGTPTITLSGPFAQGLLMATNATLSDPSGFIPSGAYIASANYSSPALTMSSNATGSATETITLTIPAFGQISDPGFLGASRIAFIEGWLICNNPGSRVFFTTGPTPYVLLFPGTWFALKDSSSDNIVTLFENERELWLLGERTTEVWYNAGNSNGVAFSRIPAVGPQIGCSATHSIARIGDNLIWLAQNEQGQNMVVLQEQYTWIRVSTHAVDAAIASYAVVNDAIGYVYEEAGHLFYVLTFPTADTTWVYDLTASKNLGKPCWHQRLSADSNGNWHRHRSNCYLNFLNTRLVGDFENGAIYALSRDYFTDNGAPLIAQRRAPHIWSKSDRKRIFHGWLQVEFTPGQGAQSGQGSNPQAMLRWSNDGGFTWSSSHEASMGPAGQYRNRCIWRRLGTARDRIYEVTVSDPVNRDIVGVTLFLEPEDEREAA